MNLGVDDAPAGLTVLKPGPLMTVQDLGRHRHRRWGVPVGGAFDVEAHELADALVGNGPEAATVELTIAGGAFRAESMLDVAMAGAPMPARVERVGETIAERTPPVGFALRRGDILTIGGAPVGLRCYLAVRGGWRTSVVLGSRSAEEPLRAGDHLPAVPAATEHLPRRLSRSPAADAESDDPIRLIDGPDAGLLRLADWHRHAYRVGPASDRMGLRLDGPPVGVASRPDRRSSPVAPGAVQIAGALPIILGVSCGTMGGYPHVAHVASADMGRLAQARPGEELRFHRIGTAEARRLDAEWRQRRAFRRIRIGCSG